MRFNIIFKVLIILTTLTAVVGSLPIPASTQISQIDRTRKTELIDGKEAVAGQVLVKFRKPIDSPNTDQVKQEIGADEIEEVGNAGARLIHSQSKDLITLLSELSARPDVIYAEPNYIIHADAVPDDPYFTAQWALRNYGQYINQVNGTPGADISAVPAWDISTGSRSNVIGVVDSGIDYLHPDLMTNLWTAPAPFAVQVGGQTIRCEAGTHGFNAITKTCDPMDDNGHGTHISGIIGAAGNNGIGVVGVNWTASIMGLKFLDASGSGTTADAINAIEFTIQAKAAFAATAGANVRILNNSWGGNPFSQALLDEINRANDKEMLFVASAGNAHSDNDTKADYPSGYNAPNIISVAATDNRDQLASFSNYGKNSVHLGAPGVDVASTLRAGLYYYRSGTSMAAPFVAGAAALVLSRCPVGTGDLKQVILNSVDQVPSLMTTTLTGGRLNVNKALGAVANCGAPPDYILSATPSSRSAVPGSAVSYSITVTPLRGFAGDVTLSVSAVPSGASADFAPPSVTASGSSILTISTTASTPPGKYLLLINGSSGSLLRTAEILLSVPEFYVTDLGALPGSVNSTAKAINNYGEVVGMSADHAFLYGNGVMQDLGTLPDRSYSVVATGINDAGQVVGYSRGTAEPEHAFIYSGGEMTDLGTLPPDTSNLISSRALAINNIGQVVGYSSDVYQRAVLYNGGALTDLGPFVGAQSSANSINNLGQIAGFFHDYNLGEDHAFLYKDNVKYDLGTLGGIIPQAAATGINDSGQVVGRSGSHAFFYSGGVMQDLGDLVGGVSWATGINNSGQVVGYSVPPSGYGYRAFLYRDGRALDLNSLIPADSNWTLNVANAINDAGQIVGEGTSPAGVTRAFLLTPVRYTPRPLKSRPSVRLTAPANGITLIAPGEITLSANASDSNGTISRVDFYNGTTLIGTATAGPYSIKAQIAAPGQYTVTARATNNAGVTSASNLVTITAVGPLPDPWREQDIGSGGLTGGTSYWDGVFTINGPGVGDWGSDVFHYVYQPLNGDGQIVARVGISRAYKAGVMIREGLTPVSSQVSMMLNPTGLAFYEWRQTTGGITQSYSVVVPALPQWVKLVRSGDTFSGYRSSDGESWVLVSSQKVDMASNVYVGLAVTSDSKLALGTAVVDSVTVNGPTPTPTPTPTTGVSRVQFSDASYSVNEGGGGIRITVTRTGDTSGPATVDYSTSDGTAPQRNKYIMTAGTLNFTPGQVSQSFTVLIEDEAYVEGNQTVNLALSNPRGTSLGANSAVVLTIIDNDSVTPTTNPIDNAQFFVHQHYLDFLNRTPDDIGFIYWGSQIGGCSNDQICINSRRVGVSAAFFTSAEFQETGYFVYRFYKAGLGRQPSYGEFMPDRSQVVGGADLEANKVAFANLFVTRAAFTQQYPTTMTAEQYVDTLNTNTGGSVAQGDRDALINGLKNGTETRATVLRKVADNQVLQQREYNAAFVLMQYFGYLRRDPDAGGYQFWLRIMNGLDPSAFRGMTCSFITSREYQERFSPVATHSNVDCGNAR